MQDIRFACTALDGTNKVGVIPKDNDGYYDMIVGGLNMFNSAGQYYEYEGAKALFEGSSPFMRRVSRGALRGEVGHPKKRIGETDDQYLDRIYAIDEGNVCVHFKEIYLDFNSMKDTTGKPVIAIRAKLTPSGAKGDFLERQLQNKNENVCFSIRSLTQDKMNRGIYTRTIKHIVTFDAVSEPGISIANKYAAPSLESYIDKAITETQVKRMCSNKLREGIATESSVAMANELLAVMGWELPKTDKPAFAHW